MYHNGHKPYGIYEKYVKRCLDCGISAIGLIALSPIIATTAIFVRINLGTPVLFQQERPGLNEKIFRIKKFRSMLDPQTRDGRKITDEERTQLIEKGIEVLSDEERLTKFGKILRATSLDELPELWNIFVGDMSFVGPRPLSTAYLPFYNEYEKHRHDVRPGLTGAAQVNGRNSALWEERFKYDVDYVNHITFMTDCKIILKTIGVVLKRSNIGQGNEIPESFHVIRQKEWEKERKDEHCR
jgi:lipopolysaccharide/colanic/teichoic acid biosynthesis glycosyltransferase